MTILLILTLEHHKPHSVISCEAGKNNIIFYLEDCKYGLTFLKDKSVDVVVTSPPYNIGVKYSNHDDNMPTDEYVTWIGDIGIEIKRVLKDNGSFFLNIGNKPSDPWKDYDVAQVIRKNFVLQNKIMWIKSIAINKLNVGNNCSNLLDDISIGHFKPVNSDRYLNGCYESIFHFTKVGNVKINKRAIGVPYQDKTNIGRWKAATEDKRDRGNTWFIPYETIQNSIERPHPSPFPVELPEMCIKLHGVSNLVVDPFCGIGSTAVACERLGVSFIGFDIDSLYLNEAVNRVNSEMRE